MTKSFPVNPCPITSKRVAVSFVNQKIEPNNPSRANSATNKPIDRARRCSLKGNFPERIEINMILSIPKTTSNTVNVIRLIQIFGSSKSRPNIMLF